MENTGHILRLESIYELLRFIFVLHSVFIAVRKSDAFSRFSHLQINCTPQAKSVGKRASFFYNPAVNEKPVNICYYKISS